MSGRGAREERGGAAGGQEVQRTCTDSCMGVAFRLWQVRGRRGEKAAPTVIWLHHGYLTENVELVTKGCCILHPLLALSTKCLFCLIFFRHPAAP